MAIPPILTANRSVNLEPRTTAPAKGGADRRAVLDAFAAELARARSGPSGGAVNPSANLAAQKQVEAANAAANVAITQSGNITIPEKPPSDRYERPGRIINILV